MSAYPPATPDLQRSPAFDFLLALAIFSVALTIFYFSPVSGIGDSTYSLLLTQNLLSRGSFVLDAYAAEHQPTASAPTPPPGTRYLKTSDYQIERVRGHYYYLFPPGTSILSAPFVAVGNAFGYSVVGPGDTYHPDREQRAQLVIGSVLMALLSVFFYFTGRLLLPPGWSACLALGGVLGTQVWSTASRDLSGHTWGVLLLGVVVYLLLARETGRRKLPPVLLATLLSWTYFVRPTNSLAIIGITVYVLLFHRSIFPVYAATGAGWFAAFVVYAWVHFGKLLPGYYQANRLETKTFGEALAGNFISPSRGLLIFVPVTLFVLYLLARHWGRLSHPRLVGLAAGVSAAQVLVVSSFNPWWGGFSYGPRFTTELVPWLVLVAALGLQAARRWRADGGPYTGATEWRVTLAAGGALLLLSVFIHYHGVASNAPKLWNKLPVSVDTQPARVWDWRHPQILAGLVHAALPDVFPVLRDDQPVSFGHEAGRAYQYEGWSDSDADFCWSDATTAKVIFAAESPSARRLRLCFSLALSARHPRQRVTIRLNDHPLARLTLHEEDAREYTFDLPPGVLQPRNVLTFLLPDAISPAAEGTGSDSRLLGLGLRWIELDPTAPPSPPR